MNKRKWTTRVAAMAMVFCMLAGTTSAAFAGEAEVYPEQGQIIVSESEPENLLETDPNNLLETNPDNDIEINSGDDKQMPVGMDNEITAVGNGFSDTDLMEESLSFDSDAASEEAEEQFTPEEEETDLEPYDDLIPMDTETEADEEAEIIAVAEASPVEQAFEAAKTSLDSIIDSQTDAYSRILAVYNCVANSFPETVFIDEEMAQLTQKLLENYGIRSCVLYGTDQTGEPVYWNLAEMGGQYYNLDASLDRNIADQMEWTAFLKGGVAPFGYMRDETFAAEEFATAYPISEADYSVSMEEIEQSDGFEVAIKEDKEEPVAISEEEKIEYSANEMEEAIEAEEDELLLGAITTLQWPVYSASNGQPIKSITSHFGSHHGIDIGAPVGSRWVAACSGTVYRIYTGCKTNANGDHSSCNPNHGRWNNGTKYICNDGFGNGVVIKCSINGSIYYMQYAHMNSVASGLVEGQSITAGTYLGEVGDRGNSYGAHAHFEINQGALFSNYVNNDPEQSGCQFAYSYSSTGSGHDITFNWNANGGNGYMAVTKPTYGMAYTLPANTFTRTGYSFKGWNLRRDIDSKWFVGGVGWRTETEANRLGKQCYSNAVRFPSIDSSFVTGYETTTNLSFTWFAVWEPVNFTFNYNSNGGSGYMASSTATFGNAYTIPATPFTKTGYTLKGWHLRRDADYQWFVPNIGWRDEATANQMGKSLYAKQMRFDYLDASFLTGNTSARSFTWFAVWEPVDLTFNYDSNGGSGTMASTTATFGNAYTIPATSFTKTGYTLKGWYLRRDEDSQWFVTNIGWRDEATANQMGKNLYGKRHTFNYLDASFLTGNTSARSFTWFAVWEKGNTDKVSVTGVKLNKTSQTITAGKTITLKATVSPANASNKAVTWKSSNTAVL